jgi:GTP-binding protein
MKIISSQLEKTSFKEAELLKDDTKKIIFVGRSNVGKSSLINKLLGRRNLARTSSTPGKTLSINYYRVANPDDNFYFVDLPGYGYARVSRQESRRVQNLIADFFRTLRSARLAILLIDSRRGFMDSDRDMVAQIVDKKIKLLTVLTKSDKLRSSDLNDQKKVLQNMFGLNVIPFTIKSNDNKEEMLKIINQALME